MGDCFHRDKYLMMFTQNIENISKANVELPGSICLCINVYLTEKTQQIHNLDLI